MASSSSLRMLSSNIKKASVSMSRSTFGTRSLHKRRGLQYPLEDGLGNFLPPQALKVAVEWQEGLLERLNEEVKGTSDEHQTVPQTVINAATAREKTLAFNYASLALNNGYFLDNVKPPSREYGNHEHEISEELNSAIKKHYTNVRQLKSSFSAAGLGMFTNGWIWLVSDSKGNLTTLPTLGPGTLLVQSRKYRAAEQGLTLFGAIRQGAAPATSPTPKTLPPGVAPTSPTSGVSSSTSPLPQDPVGGPRFLHSTALVRDAPRSSGIYGGAHSGVSTILNMGDVLFPLFCVPIYEHNWMSAGYGVWGKENWLKEFWTVVDWAKASKAYRMAKGSETTLQDGSYR